MAPVLGFCKRLDQNWSVMCAACCLMILVLATYTVRYITSFFYGFFVSGGYLVLKIRPNRKGPTKLGCPSILCAFVHKGNIKGPFCELDCVFVSMCMYVCMHAWMHACLYVCIIVCMYVSLYVSLYVYVPPRQVPL